MARRVTSLAQARDVSVSREIDSAYDNVKTVADNINAVINASNLSAEVTTVHSNIAAITTVSNNIADVVTVANDLNEAISEIETAANDLNETVSEIDTVANSITNVDLVGADIANVNIVATNIADVNTAVTNITAIINSSGNATAAQAAQIAAEAAQTAAELALDNFDDTYLGAKASDPTLDNDGDPLTEGMLYYNTAIDAMKAYNGATWEIVAIAGGLTANNNLSDLQDAPTARTNLGLGSLAVLNTVDTAQIDDEAITIAKLQHIATSSLLGRSTAGTGDVEIISTAQLKTLYESNTDTNAFTDAEKAALASLGGEYSDYIQLSTTSPTVMEEWSATTYGGAEIAILIKDTIGGASQLSMLSVLNSAVAVSAGQYSTLLLGTSDDIADLDVDISGGNVRFIVTAGSSNLTNYRMRVTLIEN